MAFLALGVACIWRLRRWAVQRDERIGRDNESAMGGGLLAGLTLIAKEPLLRWLAVLVFLGVGIGQFLYNEQVLIVRERFATAEERTAFFAGIDIAVNVLTLLVQLFATRWLLSRFGLAPVLLVPMAAAVLGFAVLAASPLPLLVSAVLVLTRSNEFSLMKPGRETIYTRVDRQWRYKAGAAIDTAFFRGGEITFSWTYKALSAFGSSVVFGAGLTWASAVIRVVHFNQAIRSKIANYVLVDLRAGAEEGVFSYPDENIARDLVVSCVVGGMRAVVEGRGIQDHDSQVAEMVLKALGATPARARKLAQQPLPG